MGTARFFYPSRRVGAAASKNAAMTNQPQENPPHQASARKLVTKPVIARRNSVCVRTVEAWMNERRISFVRIGRRGVRFDVEACDRALARFVVAEVAL